MQGVSMAEVRAEMRAMIARMATDFEDMMGRIQALEEENDKLKERVKALENGEAVDHVARSMSINAVGSSASG